MKRFKFSPRRLTSFAKYTELFSYSY